MAKKKSKKDVENVGMVSYMDNFPQQFTGEVVDVTEDAITLRTRRHGKRQHYLKTILRENIAMIQCDPIDSIDELASVNKATIYTRTAPGVYAEQKGTIVLEEDFVMATGEKSTILVANDLASIELFEEKPEKEKKEKKGKKGKKEDKKGKKGKKGKKAKEEPSYSLDDLKKMKHKALLNLIEEDDLEVDPEDYEDDEELRTAIAEALGLDMEEDSDDDEDSDDESSDEDDDDDDD